MSETAEVKSDDKYASVNRAVQLAHEVGDTINRHCAAHPDITIEEVLYALVIVDDNIRLMSRARQRRSQQSSEAGQGES